MSRVRLVIAFTVTSVLVVLLFARPTDAQTPGIGLSIQPLWQRSTPGSWSPVRVSISNTGGPDFEGELRLIPSGLRPREPFEGDPSTFDLQRGSLYAGESWVVGDRQMTLAWPSESAPWPDRFPVYRSPVSVAAGTEKTIDILVVEAPHSYAAELRDRTDKVVFRSKPPPPTIKGTTVAVLTRAAQTGELTAIPGPGRSRLLLTRLADAKGLPEDLLALTGLDVVVLDDFDTASLSERQRRSLQDYVALGGRLILGGGTTAPETLLGLPVALTPLRPAGTAMATLVFPGAAETTATVAIGASEPGHLVQADRAGTPLVLGSSFGSGRVVQMTFDPLAGPIGGSPVLSRAAWTAALAAAFPDLAGPAARRAIAPQDQLWSPASTRSPWPPPRAWVLTVLVVYALVVGPSLRPRAIARASRAKALLGAAAVGALCVVAVLISAPAEDDVIQVQTWAAGDVAIIDTYRATASVSRGPATIALAPGSAASTVPALPRLQGQGSDVAPNPPRASGGGEVRFGTSPRVRLAGGGDGRREIVTRAVARLSGTLTGRLQLQPGDGPVPTRLTGMVTNNSPWPVRYLRVQLPGGGGAPIAALIAPGETIKVDVTILGASVEPAGARRRASHEDQVMFAAASRLFTDDDQVVVTGLSAPHLPSTGRTGKVMSVVAQVMGLVG